jgi:hypothetical protein
LEENKINKEVEMKILLTSALFLVILSSCKENKWEAIVYDDMNDLSEYKILGVFDSLEICRDASASYLIQSNLQQVGDYECGLNCEFREGWGNTRICEKTEQ